MTDDVKRYLTSNKNINRGYRDLEVWKEGIDLFSLINNKLKFLKAIPYKLKAQIHDSVFSVSSNIAEGYCRRSLKENIQFNSVALASLGENYSQVFALLCAGEIDKEWFEEYDKKHYCLENKLIKLNRSFINKLKTEQEWKSDYKLRDLEEIYNNR